MTTKNKKAVVQMKKSDLDFYKMSGVFAIACVFIMLTLRMSSTITEYRKTGANLTYNFYKLCHNPVAIVAFAVVVLAVVAWFVYSKVKRVDESFKLFTSYNALTIIAYLCVFVLSFGITENSKNHTFFIVFTIVAAVLYYISKSFHIDFVFYSAMNAIFALLTYAISYKVSLLFIVFKIVLFALLLASCVLFRNKLKTKTARRGKKKKEYLFFPVFVSLAFFAVFMFSTAFARFYSPYILSSATMLTFMMIQYLVFGIIYTIRLIRE